MERRHILLLLLGPAVGFTLAPTSTEPREDAALQTASSKSSSPSFSKSATRVAQIKLRDESESDS
jgi:hypothetical protein